MSERQAQRTRDRETLTEREILAAFGRQHPFIVSKRILNTHEHTTSEQLRFCGVVKADILKSEILIGVWNLMELDEIDGRK